MASSRRALWSRRALKEIDDIWDYYANVAGREVAGRLIRDIHRVRLLEDHPLAGRVRDQAMAGMRSMSTNPHVIFIGWLTDSPRSCGLLMADAMDEVLNTDLDANS
jgi:plasmid stabilization system protein ParE